MRIQPRPVITLGLAVGYMGIISLVWALTDFDYETFGDSTSGVLTGVVVPVALGGLFLAGATTALGWWRPALREERRAPRWLWLAPALMVLPGLGQLLGGAGRAERPVGYLLVLLVGALLIGFGEEMLTRGAGLVGLRGGFGEAMSWLLSCLLFALLHGINLLFGQGVTTTAQQIVLAFFSGSVFYVTRRVSGHLVVCMLLHAWFDYTAIAWAPAATDARSPFVALGLAQNVAVIVALVGVVVLLRRPPGRPAVAAVG